MKVFLVFEDMDLYKAKAFKNFSDAYAYSIYLKSKHKECDLLPVEVETELKLK